MLASILINNYNYGRFLRDAIDSALNQTYPHVEVIVVDDGSTDDSREIIASYGDRIIPVLKENGGQASAFNAGFVASKGGVICFLDADDVFFPKKVATAIDYLLQVGDARGDIMIDHQVAMLDETLEPLGSLVPRLWSSKGDNYYELAVKYRYIPYAAATTSGIMLTRSLAARIFPMPEGFPIGGNNFIVKAAALLGQVYSLDSILAGYRVHGKNFFFGSSGAKPREFWEAEERYLNCLLSSNGKKPILSYFDSLYSRPFYIRSGDSKGLIRLAVSVPLERFDLLTVRFAIKTLFIAASTWVRGGAQRIRILGG